MAMTSLEAGALYRLMAWLSPAYPTGAFSYSHGLEYAVEAGLVGEANALAAWVRTVVEKGAGWIDALILAEAWRAAAAADLARLGEVTVLASAWRGTAEMALESEAQGRAFLTATRAAWPHPLLDALAGSGETIALPVAVGAAAGAAAIPLDLSLQAYLQSLAGNLVSAGLRLVPLGQTDGQRIIAGLASTVADTAQRALAAELENAGSAAPLIDWCSMQHETQYTRLFRS
jgi:urease accessory protein